MKQVLYPGLEDSVGHSHARELFGGYGGVVSMELEGGKEAATAFIHVQLILRQFGKGRAGSQSTCHQTIVCFQPNEGTMAVVD